MKDRLRRWLKDWIFARRHRYGPHHYDRWY
jgi:hypothetical protein